MIKASQLKPAACTCKPEPGVPVCDCAFRAEWVALNTMVDAFASMMKAKLVDKLYAGVDGWENEQSKGFLTGAIMQKVCGPDIHAQLVDIANLCAMVWNFNAGGDAATWAEKISESNEKQARLVRRLIGDTAGGALPVERGDSIEAALLRTKLADYERQVNNTKEQIANVVRGALIDLEDGDEQGAIDALKALIGEGQG